MSAFFLFPRDMAMDLQQLHAFGKRAAQSTRMGMGGKSRLALQRECVRDGWSIWQ
jgi:hypothetical protein